MGCFLGENPEMAPAVFRLIFLFTSFSKDANTCMLTTSQKQDHMFRKACTEGTGAHMYWHIGVWGGGVCQSSSISSLFIIHNWGLFPLSAFPLHSAVCSETVISQSIIEIRVVFRSLCFYQSPTIRVISVL